MKFSLIIHTCLIALISLSIMSCKKDKHTPPKLEFKTGGSYVSVDGNYPKQDTLLIGITATKTEDDLNTFNVSFAYDNAGSTTTYSNESVSGGEKGEFSRDVKIPLRNQAGTERWVFTVTDADGNIKSLSLNFTVN